MPINSAQTHISPHPYVSTLTLCEGTKPDIRRRRSIFAGAPSSAPYPTRARRAGEGGGAQARRQRQRLPLPPLALALALASVLRTPAGDPAYAPPSPLRLRWTVDGARPLRLRCAPGPREPAAAAPPRRSRRFGSAYTHNEALLFGTLICISSLQITSLVHS